jgi:uncharacterized protein YcbK (DUF882 family)
MRLSTNFILNEFVNDADPVKPDKAVIANLQELCRTVLEPLRTQLGKPIQITSGYRSPVHNARIGGAKGSMHCLGIAADIAVPGENHPNTTEQIKMARLLYQNPNVGGIGLYERKSIIHVDIREWVGSYPSMWLENRQGRYVKLPDHILAQITRG